MSRLEELENKRQAFNNAVEGLDYGRAVTIGSYTGALRSRVEELESRYEKAVDESEIFQREHLQARKRARKYKQALEFYANNHTWHIDKINEVARKALEEEEK